MTVPGCATAIALVMDENGWLAEPVGDPARVAASTQSTLRPSQGFAAVASGRAAAGGAGAGLVVAGVFVVSVVGSVVGPVVGSVVGAGARPTVPYASVTRGFGAGLGAGLGP